MRVIADREVHVNLQRRQFALLGDRALLEPLGDKYVPRHRRHLPTRGGRYPP